MTVNSFDHADSKRISVARWMVDVTADDDGSANWTAAALFAQVTWWCQPNERTGQARATHRHPGVEGVWLVRSDEEWAEELGISARTVQRARRRLIERGLVECRRLRERTYTAMHWRRLYPALPDEVSGHSPDEVSGPDLDIVSGKGPDQVSGAYKEEKGKEKGSKDSFGDLAVAGPEPKIEAGSDQDPHFVAFWSAYPSKKDKGGARKAWRAALKKAPAETIVAGSRRFAADPNLPDPAYIPHPKTWLNGERWNDGPLPSRIHRQSGRDSTMTAVADEIDLLTGGWR